MCVWCLCIDKWMREKWKKKNIETQAVEKKRIAYLNFNAICPIDGEALGIWYLDKVGKTIEKKQQSSEWDM